MNKDKKPSIQSYEGLLDYFNAPFPYDSEDPRQIGFSIGRQIIGLYLVEMLLKYALDKSNIEYKNTHHLHDLFRKLPLKQRKGVEKLYKKILNSGTARTWDVAKTANSLLAYLGKNPITRTRYFWEEDKNAYHHRVSILIMPQNLRTLIYALFICLHDYPTQKIVKKYNTKFDSLRDSLDLNFKTISSTQ